jgi:hypothetical protein
MNFLKQSTAATLKLGPFLDETDGKTAETGLTISQADVRLSKNGGNMAQKNESTSCTHDEIGFYDCPLDATDTNTLGRLLVAVHEAGALPVWAEFTVLPANVYDSLIGGSDYLQADAVQVEGADATDQINAACDTAISDAALATAANLATVDTVVDAILADTGTDGVVVAAGSKTGYALTTTEHTNITDALLKRDWTAVTGEAARSVLNALRVLRNRVAISGTTLTVYKEDDSTSAWTGTVTASASANPITQVDPS